MSEKLQKVLARAGVGSRREMEKYIDSNRVSVNGKVARLGDRVEENVVIRVDGHVVKIEQQEERVCRVLMYHKPNPQIRLHLKKGKAYQHFQKENYHTADCFSFSFL